MDENKHIDQLRQRGWEEMSDMLDSHMPAGKKRPVIWWYWLAGAAALALLITMSWPYMMNDNPSTIPGSNLEMITKQENSNSKIVENTPISDNGKSKGIPGDLTTARSDSKNLSVPSLNKDAIIRSANARSEDVVSPSAKNPDHDARAMGFSEKSQTSKEEKSHNTRLETNISTNPPGDVALLTQHDFRISHPDPSLTTYSFNEMQPIKISPSAKKLKVLAFSEMMWSLSDQFGFVNAGPGLEYDFGKLTLGASAGIVLPVPRQKTFDNSNQPFSKQYNFSQQLANEAYDFHGVTSGNVVYYENYIMKPGFKFDVFAQVKLSPFWSIGMSVGRIGYGWDFTQKAIPNQTVAANTALTNLKNDLWYGGLTASFAMSEHWALKGGVRFINPGDPENIGVLPNLRLEYRF